MGWGAVLNSQDTARGFWSSEQKQRHISLLELKAVRFAVESFLQALQGRTVIHFEDNQAVVSVLTNLTSRSPILMHELRKLWWLLDMNDITLRTRYIRSAANVWADSLSRELGLDDWKLNPSVFQELERSYGPHTVERFAAFNNHHLPRYNSLMHDPQSEAIDGLAQDWRGENNYLNPPWDMLDQVAQKLEECPVEATVGTPYWPNTLWFPRLYALAVSVWIFPPRPDLFLPGRQGSIRSVGSAPWSVAVFRVLEPPRF